MAVFKSVGRKSAETGDSPQVPSQQIIAPPGNAATSWRSQRLQLGPATAKPSNGSGGPDSQVHARHSMTPTTATNQQPNYVASNLPNPSCVQMEPNRSRTTLFYLANAMPLLAGHKFGGPTESYEISHPIALAHLRSVLGLGYPTRATKFKPVREQAGDWVADRMARKPTGAIEEVVLPIPVGRRFGAFPVRRRGGQALALSAPKNRVGKPVCLS